MNRFSSIPAVLATALFVLPLVAYAEPMQCKLPPYGAREAEYQGYLKSYANIFPNKNDLDQILQRVCVGKYDPASAQREALRTLLFLDPEIDNTSTADLTVQTISRMKAVVGGR
jgi:hypothetical protein